MHAVQQNPALFRATFVRFAVMLVTVIMIAAMQAAA